MARARRLTDREQPSRHEGGGNFARPRNNRAGQGLARNKILKCALSVLRVGFQFIGLEALAILFRLQLPDAVDAGGIAFTNRLLYSEELRVAMQTRTTRYVIQLVILILRYCDRLRNLVRIRSARGSLPVTPWH